MYRIIVTAMLVWSASLWAAPVLVVESGTANSPSYAYVLEYDDRGFLHRASQFSMVWDKLVRVMVYQVGDDYDDAVAHEFSREGEDLFLQRRFRHTGDGSYVWTKATKSERKYTSTPLSSWLDYRGRYPALKPVLPLP
ncbi:MAG: hypothetical protein MI745_08035 [Pseudomonadales bacterium]|nr:hypothetical protein [Pseudomonadales bacterium]